MRRSNTAIPIRCPARSCSPPVASASTKVGSQDPFAAGPRAMRWINSTLGGDASLRENRFQVRAHITNTSHCASSLIQNVVMVGKGVTRINMGREHVRVPSILSGLQVGSGPLRMRTSFLSALPRKSRHPSGAQPTPFLCRHESLVPMAAGPGHGVARRESGRTNPVWIWVQLVAENDAVSTTANIHPRSSVSCSAFSRLGSLGRFADS